MSYNFSPRIVTDGLLLYLDAANTKSYPGSGTVWTDLSRGGNNGILNGPTFNIGNGGGVVFDGTDDSVSLPNGLLLGTGDFTVNQWIKSNNISYGTTFGNYPSGNLQIFYGINYIGMYLNNDSTYLGVSPWNTVLPQFTTSPTMITASRFGSTTYFYINGVLQKTGSSSSTIGISSSVFKIGTISLGGEPFSGTIFNSQVYNRALSTSEVLQNYNATKSRFGLI